MDKNKRPAIPAGRFCACPHPGPYPGIPAAHPNCHPERAQRAEGSPTRNLNRPGIPVPHPAPTLTPESRRPTLSVIPSERSEPRDLHPEIPAILRPRGLPSNCHPTEPRSGDPRISNPEPLLSGGKGTCLGADHTKESLSFSKQPSPFKGRNQSWFHPLRTPSRPGAAAPGPRRGAASSRWPFRIPSTGPAPPTASCSVLGDYWHRITF